MTISAIQNYDKAVEGIKTANLRGLNMIREVGMKYSMINMEKER